MSIWLFELHMPERHFWHEMNPRRLIALYNDHFGRQRQTGRSVSTVGTNNQEPMGIYSAIMEMGGR